MLARLPSGRASTLAEVAAAVVFLASDDASNIHGTRCRSTAAGRHLAST